MRKSFALWILCLPLMSSACTVDLANKLEKIEADHEEARTLLRAQVALDGDRPRCLLTFMECGEKDIGGDRAWFQDHPLARTLPVRVVDWKEGVSFPRGAGAVTDFRGELPKRRRSSLDEPVRNLPILRFDRRSGARRAALYFESEPEGGWRSILTRRWTWGEVDKDLPDSEILARGLVIAQIPFALVLDIASASVVVATAPLTIPLLLLMIRSLGEF